MEKQECSSLFILNHGNHHNLFHAFQNKTSSFMRLFCQEIRALMSKSVKLRFPEKYKQELKRINSIFKMCEINPIQKKREQPRIDAEEVRKRLKEYNNTQVGFRNF